MTLTWYPSSAPGVFCCSGQSGLTATVILSVAVPGGWECVANGPVTRRPSAGRPGRWQFGPAPGMAPCEVALCAGPLVTGWHGGGGGGHVAMTVRRRRSLGGADGVAGLGTSGELPGRAIGRYERLLGVRCAFPEYDIVAVPGLAVLAESMPGLMLVDESLLARMIDPDDGKAAIVAAHEVAHLWFGCLVGARWWDDVWLDEAMASAAGPRQQALAAGFAASAHGASQLDLLRAWLSGGLLPDGLSLTAGLRARVLFTLSARGLADDGNLGALAAADPAAGEQHRATCRAMRPDPAGKEAAWQAALAGDQDLRMAEAHARGLRVAGQEDLMAGYRDRYFTEALPALADREPRTARRPARLLYPATLVSPATVAATDAALQARHPGGQLRVIVQEQQAILRSALAARSAARWLNLS